VEIVNESELYSFAKKHSNARRPLSNWTDVTKSAAWKSFAEVRETFRSADYVKDQVVFDIGGNNYGLISSIDYLAQRVYVLEMMTHADYVRGRNEYSKG
jgi:mRNA interferase HigB